MSTLMNPQELVRRYNNYRAAHSGIYHNPTPIYKNDAPIYGGMASALVYIMDLSPETYEKIQDYICKAGYVAASKAGDLAWEEIKEYCPENCRGYVETIGFFLFDVFTP